MASTSDTFMELSDPSVWGETIDHQFGMGPGGRKLGAFEIASFKFGVSKASDPAKDAKAGGKPVGTASSGHAAAAIKEPTLQNISISKAVDKASPDLFLCCCKKDKIAWAIVSFRESGELNRVPFLVLEFRNLTVVSFNWELNPGDTESAGSMETVEFDYETVMIKYSRQEFSGEHRIVKMKGWNRPLHNDNVSELDPRLGAADLDDDSD